MMKPSPAVSMFFLLIAHEARSEKEYSLPLMERTPALRPCLMTSLTPAASDSALIGSSFFSGFNTFASTFFFGVVTPFFAAFLAGLAFLVFCMVSFSLSEELSLVSCSSSGSSGAEAYTGFLDCFFEGADSFSFLETLGALSFFFVSLLPSSLLKISEPFLNIAWSSCPLGTVSPSTIEHSPSLSDTMRCKMPLAFLLVDAASTFALIKSIIKLGILVVYNDVNIEEKINSKMFFINYFSYTLPNFKNLTIKWYGRI